MIKHSTFLKILGFSAIVILSCRNSPKDLIVNTWEITEMRNGNSSHSSDLSRKKIIGTRLEFTEAGRYRTFPDSTLGNGTYTVSKDGKSITMVYAQIQGRETIDIDTITASRLVIRDNRGTSFILEPR